MSGDVRLSHPIIRNVYIIIEKEGDQGELKIMPRTFDRYEEALKYLEDVNRSLITSNLVDKRLIKHFIVRADNVEFIGFEKNHLT